MARGWESKSVEQQQEEATHGEEKRRMPMSAEQIAEEKRRQGIELSRQRILQQLQVACNPRHRAMLERALADLDAQLGSNS
jgi:glutathionyl-hydroquinone reductase